MISPATLQRGLYALLFAALAALHIFARVLPIEGTFGDMPPPELIVLAGFAWVAQRPDYVPVAMFAALMLMADLLFLRPPGISSGLAVIGLEAMRARAALFRERGFLAEWLTVAFILTLMLAAERALLAVFFVAQPGFGLVAIGLIVNILAYPAVVAVSYWGLGVRRLAPGEHAAEARLV
ncbi:MAG: rod shape-determining protein MreD [Maritimibacter sp.]|nr:rod shape-determining protein MreD [Maritimibacter sp.]